MAESDSNPSWKLSSVPLNGINYVSWSKAVTLSLGGKKKLGFLDGSKKCPPKTESGYEDWIAHDSLIRSWLINSMEAHIAQIFTFSDSAQELWESVAEMYGNHNVKILRVLNQLGRILQELSQSISSHTNHSGSTHVSDTIKWDGKGLVPAIAQHVDTGAILMQGYANREALNATISSRKATFYSRSRSSLWTKGETSNNFINVEDIFLDCDRDSILYLGMPDGPACHTGQETCYHFSVDDFLRDPEVKENKLALPTLFALEFRIFQRLAEIGAEQNGKPSWTKKLLLDPDLLYSKLREECHEVLQTMENNEGKGRTSAESGDLVYHLIVLLTKKGVQLKKVVQVLRKRFSQSGIEEKSSRSQPQH